MGRTMKKLGLKSEETAKKSSLTTVKQRSSISRFAAHFTLGAALIGATLVAAVSLPRSARAQEKPAVSASESLPPKLSLGKQVRLKPRYATEVYQRGMAEDYIVPLESGGRLRLDLVICSSDSDCSGVPSSLGKKRLTILTQGVPSVPDESRHGTVIAIIDLTQLDALYRKITGKEMKHAAVLTDVVDRPEAGKGIVIIVAPVEKPGDEVKPGTPAIFTIYFDTLRGVTEEKERLLAMAQ